MYLVRKNSKAVKIYGGFLSVAAILLLVTFIAVRLGLVPDSHHSRGFPVIFPYVRLNKESRTNNV